MIHYTRARSGAIAGTLVGKSVRGLTSLSEDSIHRLWFDKHYPEATRRADGPFSTACYISETIREGFGLFLRIKTSPPTKLSRATIMNQRKEKAIAFSELTSM